MIYGNSKTLLSLNQPIINAAVGFFAMILRSFYPNALNQLVLVCLGGNYFFYSRDIPFKQFKSGYSLEQIELTKRPFRTLG